MLSKLRIFNIKNIYSRGVHNTKGKIPDYRGNAYYDQFSAHSPLQISRHRTDELRSKLFFEHPPVPNRIAKFFFLFAIMACISTGARDKALKRHKS